METPEYKVNPVLESFIACETEEDVLTWIKVNTNADAFGDVVWFAHRLVSRLKEMGVNLLVRDG